MAEVQTDLSGVVAIFVKLGEHTRESVREAALGRSYDCAWVRVASGRTAHDKPISVLRLDILDVDAGAPIRDDTLLAELSSSGRTAILVIFGEVIGWRNGGMLEGAPAAALCREVLGVEPQALASLDESAEHPLSLSVARGRVLNSGAVPPPPFFYRFRDRGLTQPGGAADEDEEANPDSDDDGDDDRAVLFVCDVPSARRLYQERPASEALAALENAIKGAPAQARLGPFAHALPRLREALTAAAEAPAASAADTTLFEALLTLEGYGTTAGESVRYLDERFFPVLGLSPTEQLPPLDGELDELEDMGILTAMVEILPYRIPEGSVMQAFSDQELQPAHGAAGLPLAGDADGAVEASVFIVQTERLLGTLRAFDPTHLSSLVERFARHWYAALGGAATGLEFEGWAQARGERDHAELDRFLVTLNDLDAVLDTADRNGLQVALAFYGAG